MTDYLINKLKITRTLSCHHQHNLSAIILRKGKILSAAANNLKTDPKSPHFFKSTHAEFAACKKIKNKELLNGATILIYRENADGKQALARPCESCLNYLEKMKIKYMIYSTKVGFIREKL
jgi:pyrimidine deaminase RibD-like protein